MGLHSFKIIHNEEVWGHDGGELGTTTMVGVNPLNKIGVIILTNISDAELESVFIQAFKLSETF